MQVCGGSPAQDSTLASPHGDWRVRKIPITFSYVYENPPRGSGCGWVEK